MEKQPILVTNDLHKYYGEIKAVREISLEIYPGEVFGLLGPNGAGKTTIINLILDLVQPTAGTITLFGQKLNGQAVHLSRRVGAVLTNPAFYPYLSGWDNLQVFAGALGGVDQARIEHLIEFVGLQERSKTKFKTYSTGMKQRLSIACALLTDPELILLDEPTHGLDPAGMRETRQMIKTLATQGKTIILASHILSEVEQVCQRIAVLNKGQLVAQGSIDELVHRDQRLQIDVREPEAAAHHLATLAGVGNIVSENSYIMVEATLDDAEKISQHLAQANIFPRRIELVGSDLESFFLELTEDSREN
jgi:ABC-2 type transport system ATP-binding protein